MKPLFFFVKIFLIDYNITDPHYLQEKPMPLYDYECSECLHGEEISQKFSEIELSRCPECKKESFRRVILTPPLAFIKGDPLTLGQLADRNTEKLGKYELEDRQQADNTETAKADQESRDFRKKLNKMTPSQTKRYIEKGDLPSG